MRLVYKDSQKPVQVGDVVSINGRSIAVLGFKTGPTRKGFLHLRLPDKGIYIGPDLSRINAEWVDDPPLTYSIGTEVQYTEQVRESLPDLPAGGVVTETSIFRGRIFYAVNGDFWFYEPDLIFVAHPTKESVERAIALAPDLADEVYIEEEDVAVSTISRLFNFLRKGKSK